MRETGGNIAGALLKKLSLGPVGNSIAGIVGGGIGGQLLGMLMGGGAAAAPAAGGFDIGSLVAQIGGGGIGGGRLPAPFATRWRSRPSSASRTVAVF